MKTNLKKYLDPARKTTSTAIAIKGVTDALGIMLIGIAMGAITIYFCLQEEIQPLGIVAGAVIILVCVWVFISSVISCKRWMKRLKYEDAARKIQAPEGTPSPVMNDYSFCSLYQERVNEVMQDDTKKFAIITPGSYGLKNASLKRTDGSVAAESNANHIISVFPSDYTFKNYISGDESKHVIRTAIFQPNGLLIKLGKLGSVSSDLGIPSDYIVDGKIFWHEFYKNGYYFDRTYEGIRPIYSIKKNGVEVAVIEAKALSETIGHQNKVFDNVTSGGQFNVKCADEEINTILRVCLFLYYDAI